MLKWAADGTAYWGDDNNTTYGPASTTANGLMSAGDKGKLNNCLRQDVLYNNANGTIGAVTLSASKNNYAYLDIFASIGGRDVFERVYVKTTNYVRFRDHFVESSSQYSFRDELITISTWSIARNQMAKFTITSVGKTALSASTTEFKIHKVVGWR